MNALRLLHHWFVPHEANNHRSRALHVDALFSYTLLLLVFNFILRFGHMQMPDILGYATDIRVEQLLGSTNVKRQDAGLSALQLNTTLSQAAAAKAADMFANNYWAHNSPSGKTPWDFINASGYRYTLAGENLAKNFQSSDGVVDAWMNSETHKANLLKAGYNDVGFAVVNGVLNGEETTLVVQMFGATKSAPIANVPQVQAQEPQAAPVAQTTPAAEPVKPIVIPNEPVVTQAPVEASTEPVSVVPLDPAPTFMSVATTPRINLSALSRQVVFIFVGMLMGILALDGYIVSRKKVVRLSGHNAAHILFLVSMVVGGLFLTRGSLL